MFAEAIATILDHHGTPAAVRAIESGASALPLAQAIADAGFLELLTPEAQGGAGASWADFFDVVLLCGSRAVPLPLAQSLAARLLVEGPGALPQGQITFAPSLVHGSNGALQALHVPAARSATHVIGALDDSLVLLAVSDADQVPTGVHGSLALSLRWNARAARPLASTVPAQDLLPLAALLHAALLAGAMKQAFDLTMRHANERVQFGKSIGKFQAIQHQLSVMAEQVAAARMAAQAAFGTGTARPAAAACAVAKARTSEAAQAVASIAHAVHGAIGVTEEYDLHLYTRRLHEWRMAHGSESYWHRVLGQLFVDSDAPLTADFVRSLI